MMVIFLVGLVSMILMRTLRKDYARYSKEEDLDDMVCMFLFTPDILYRVQGPPKNNGAALNSPTLYDIFFRNVTGNKFY